MKRAHEVKAAITKAPSIRSCFTRMTGIAAGSP
jgi:hypothetical protein